MNQGLREQVSNLLSYVLRVIKIYRINHLADL